MCVHLFSFLFYKQQQSNTVSINTTPSSVNAAKYRKELQTLWTVAKDELSDIELDKTRLPDDVLEDARFGVKMKFIT